MALAPALLLGLAFAVHSRWLSKGLFLFSLVAWALVALWVGASGERSQLLARRLATLRVWHWCALAASCLLLAWLTRRNVVTPWWGITLAGLTHFTLTTEKPKFTAFGLLLGIPALFACGEICLWAFSSKTAGLWLPKAYLVRQLHRADWSVIQFEPECSQGDEELLYTLRPGSCIFADVEFRTEVKVNRIGVRDDEESLIAPEIIVAGDSHSMGWGVAQQETYAAHLERITGKRVLNMGIASYGTARELAFLKRADLSQARYLLLQYSENDYGENIAYGRAGFKLPRHTLDEHRKLSADLAQQKKYWFGRYLSLGFGDWLNQQASAAVSGLRDAFSRSVPAPTGGGGQADGSWEKGLFDVLAHPPVDTSRFRILLFEMGRMERRNSAEQMKEAIAKRADRDRLANITVVNVLAGVLDANTDYLPLDGHTNARGHAKVARVLAQYLK